MKNQFGRQVAMMLYMPPELKKKLKRLSKATEISMNQIIREGIDLALCKYEKRRSEK